MKRKTIVRFWTTASRWSKVEKSDVGENVKHAASSLSPLPVSSLVHALAFRVLFPSLFHGRALFLFLAPLSVACLFPSEQAAAAAGGDGDERQQTRKTKMLEVPLSTKALARRSLMATKELVKNEAV